MKPLHIIGFLCAAPPLILSVWAYAAITGLRQARQQEQRRAEWERETTMEIIGWRVEQAWHEWELKNER